MERSYRSVAEMKLLLHRVYFLGRSKVWSEYHYYLTKPLAMKTGSFD